MKYWDASAIVPLIVAEPGTRSALLLLAQDAQIVTWWGTLIECLSAVARAERNRTLIGADLAQVLGLLDQLAASWTEVEPHEQIRRVARRLLRMHPLRAADSMQLAACLVCSEDNPATLQFVCYDERLRGAAEREGLELLPRSLPAELAV